jgi:hypothetical protein
MNFAEDVYWMRIELKIRKKAKSNLGQTRFMNVMGELVT